MCARVFVVVFPDVLVLFALFVSTSGVGWGRCNARDGYGSNK